MKKFGVLMLSLAMICTMFSVNSFADSDKEMRAAWISSVYNIDWPKTKNDEAQQKKEYIELLNNLQNVGINTVVVQVRPKSDALYKSSINPWSEYLTGTQGKDPGYDPLPFLIQEAHKRGMEFHAWFNPYRVTTSTTDLNTLAVNHPARKNPSWVVQHKNGSYDALTYNPGLPEVRQYIVDTIAEVVRNYDVDGVHFDDYFYPNTGFDDEATYQKYGNGQTKDNWRRENVNTLLRDVKSTVKSIKPSVVFGVSPAGIWRNKSSDPTGSDTRGNESYSSHYADTRAWIKQGLVDYVVPQIYWTIGYAVADYSKLVDWWVNEVKGTDVDLYIGQAVYRQGENGNLDVAGEITNQINLNRQYSEVKGSMHFSAKDIVRNSKLQSDLKSLYLNNTPPPVTPPETNIKVESLKGDLRYDTAVAVSKKGWTTGSDTVVLVNGNSIVDGITSTPLATSKDAPILLLDKNQIPTSTKTELQRLNPKNAILIGGTSVIQENVLSEIKSLLPSVSTTRIGGIDRYETSLKIAKEISSINDINKVYVTSGIGEPDALSIASKAGQEKQPIVLSSKDSMNDDTYNWLKSQNILDAYFIGGNAVLSDNIINKINEITSNDVSKNRIYGETRQDTNAKVIEKFYLDSKYPSVLVTKSNPLVDALTAGPLAAKLNLPIVMVGNSTTSSQNSILNSKSTELVYQVGGGINQSAFNKVLELLN